MFESLFNDLKQSPIFFLISGPCVIEDEALTFRIAENLKEVTTKRNIPFVFKASFQKANRTSYGSFQGPGIYKGLEILSKIKSEFKIPILTDVHETTDIKLISEVCDIIQIPAFLSRQTPLIQSAAQSGKIVNIKKGQFMAPEDMLKAAQKVTASDNNKVLLTERGTTFGYHNLVVDFRSFPILHSFGFPVVYDVTHSLQKPSETDITGGSPEYVSMMAQAALATGKVNGLFIETHPNPKKALSDAASMVALDTIPSLLDKCILIKSALGN